MNKSWLRTVRQTAAAGGALRGARDDGPGSSTLIALRSPRAPDDGAPNVVLDVYRLVSIESSTAPAPGVGDNWLVYRIARGANVVTGYRCGTRASVTVDVEKIVEGLNERLFVQPRRVNIRLGKPASPKPRA